MRAILFDRHASFGGISSGPAKNLQDRGCLEKEHCEGKYMHQGFMAVPPILSKGGLLIRPPNQLNYAANLTA
jgi:hypothetical protein